MDDVAAQWPLPATGDCSVQVEYQRRHTQIRKKAPVFWMGLITASISFPFVIPQRHTSARPRYHGAVTCPFASDLTLTAPWLILRWPFTRSNSVFSVPM